MKKRKIVLEILSGLFIVIAVLYFVFGYKERKEFLSKKEFISHTIGTIESINYGVRVAPWYNYSFFVKRNKKKGNYSLIDNKLRENSRKEQVSYIGKSFLVKFSKEKPKYNELLWEKPAPDSLVKCCKHQVWEEPPF